MDNLFSIPPDMAQFALVPIFSFPFGDRLPLHVLWSIRTTVTKWIDMIDDITRTFPVLQPGAGTGAGSLKECSGRSATMRVRRRVTGALNKKYHHAQLRKTGTCSHIEPIALEIVATLLAGGSPV